MTATVMVPGLSTFLDLLNKIIFLFFIFYFLQVIVDCRSQWPCGLRRGSWPVGCWDRGFESCLRHGCLSASFCVVLSCVGRGLATG
jgi:hypothetical protein